MNVTSFHRPCTVHGARCTMHGAINKRNPMEAIRSLILFCFLASAVCAHLGKDVVAKSSLFPHPAEVQIMDESFPSNPSYVIVQFSMTVALQHGPRIMGKLVKLLKKLLSSILDASSDFQCMLVVLVLMNTGKENIWWKGMRLLSLLHFFWIDEFLVEYMRQIFVLIRLLT